MESIPPANSHYLPNGTVHPIQIGIRLKETVRSNIKREIELNPLKPVGTIYEEEYQKVKDSLDSHDREELISVMPTARQMERCMYRWRAKRH